MLALLHSDGLSVFALDYRGFGASDSSKHPSSERMSEDSEAALSYLTTTRHIPESSVVPYGTGLGASLAVGLARSHPGLPAVILDNPDPDPAGTAASAEHSRIVPIRLLVGTPFDIATPVANLATPKLFIAGGPSRAGAKTAEDHNQARLQSFFRTAASPRLSVTLPATNSETSYQAMLSRFLDQYLIKR